MTYRGARFYFSKASGNLIYMCPEANGIGVQKSNISEDLLYVLELKDFTIEDLIVKEFDYGHFPEGHFEDVDSISLDLASDELIFVRRVEETFIPFEIRIQQLELENVELHETIAMLYESALGE